MAATITVEQAGDLGDNTYFAIGTIKGDNSYATGGYAVGAGAISGQGVKIERVAYLNATGSGYVSDFDLTNQKVKFRINKDPGAAGGADVVLPEVGNTTDLSAVTIPFVAFGQ
jgi:hypothetical protein